MIEILLPHSCFVMLTVSKLLRPETIRLTCQHAPEYATDVIVDQGSDKCGQTIVS